VTDPFVHLRVASGYSLRYGASHPSTLVERAAEYDMDTLALTDRDGLYGAVRFAKACLRVGIAPVLGVDLAVPFALPRLGATAAGRVSSRTPTRGGAVRDLRLPRVVVLASSKAGWAALCRLVSATHLSGARGEPVSSAQLIAEHAASGEVVVMLGADSEIGTALAAERPERRCVGGRRSSTPHSWRWRSPTTTGRVPVSARSATPLGCSPWPTSRG
jgi:error-prone DNA polymerase